MINLIIGIDYETRGETNLGLFSDLEVQMNMANWMIENVDQDATLCTDFVNHMYLTNFNAGYVNEETMFTSALEPICLGCDSAEYIIVSNTNGCYSKAKAEGRKYQLVFTDTIGPSNIAVYTSSNPPL
ncbi:MAG: hypothetical protein Salg2KO_20110 [Salibacteraceae bacterium]